MAVLTWNELALQQVNSLLERLFFEASRTASEATEEAVHDLRVTIRRFSQAARVFGDLLPRKKVKRFRKRLKGLMDLAGEVRERDIAFRFATKARVDGLKERFGAERRVAAEALQMKAARMVDRGAPVWSVAGGRRKRAGAMASKMLPELAAEFFEAGRAAAVEGVDAEAMHQFRLRGKRFRYTLELFRPVLGATVETRLALLKQVQTFLGDVNDCAATRALVGLSDDGTRLLEFLENREEKERAQFRSYWRGTFDRRGQSAAWARYLGRVR